MANGRIETKVQAASLSAAAAGAALWALQTYVFKGNAVPPGLVSLIDVAVPAVLAAAAGYLAPHTPRPAPALPVGRSSGRYGIPLGPIPATARPAVPPAAEPADPPPPTPAA